MKLNGMTYAVCTCLTPRRSLTPVSTSAQASRRAGFEALVLLVADLKTEWLQAWEHPRWFLKIHNRKCNYSPPSLAIHQKQKKSQPQGGHGRRQMPATLFLTQKGCRFPTHNQGRGALPSAHTEERELRREPEGICLQVSNAMGLGTSEGAS